MDNYEIADKFSLLAKLMDIHGENSFRSKSFSIMAFQLEKVAEPLTEMTLPQIANLKGVGEGTAKKIQEIITTGRLSQLDEIIAKTPAGVIEMLHIKGIGPKKINTIWKEMEVESIGELLYACNENRLTLFKGFGEKTQQTVKENIEFYLRNQGSFLYSEIEVFAHHFLTGLKKMLSPARVEMVGGVPMHDDTIDHINFVTDANAGKLKIALEQKSVPFEVSENNFHFKLEEGVRINIECVEAAVFMEKFFTQNSSLLFLDELNKKTSVENINSFSTETAFFASFGHEFIPPYLRHLPQVLAEKTLPKIIQPTDINGIIHNHSNWSDGSQTIEQMAKAAMDKGFSYLVISDHSKTATYASGLSEEKVKAQHQQIDELNNKLAPFKIFKSIESDILNDGSLDYSDNILSTFDLVIASVHSNLKMTEEKAMTRVMKAIENPYTTILGHATGRLLLSRNGYPINHKKVIDACAANHVVIELNANPRRLDMDWTWIPYAMEKGVLISIDPDAHSIEGYNDILYGVLAAQKGLLTADRNLSSFSLAAFEAFLEKRRIAKGI
jgi:DNA polymerase (family 10)